MKRKPPEHNFVNWDLNTFKRLIGAPPERLVSRFQVSHGMLLNVLSRRGDGCRAMQRLIRDCHEPEAAKQAHPAARVAAVPRARRARRRRVRAADRGRRASCASTSTCRTTSRWTRRCRSTCSRRCRCSTRESPDYALDVLTLVESILENPELILRKQLDRIKDRAMAEMKADGIEYEQRMEELEKLEYPKPLRDFVYDTFNAFADRHPWVGEENIRPKSIAREMFENFRSFADYVLDYELQRSEGLLLRHLNSVYKVLSQTVPDGVKTDEVREMELYLRTLLRQVDSSLEDEWERMRDPDYQPFAPRPGAAKSCGRPAPRRPRRTSRATRRRSPPRSARASSRSCARGRSATTRPRSTRSTTPSGPPRRRRRRVDAGAAPSRRSTTYRVEHERGPLRSRGAQRPAHARRSVRRRPHLARAAGAGRPGAAQRLDGGVRGGPGGLARGEPAGAVAAGIGSDRVAVVDSFRAVCHLGAAARPTSDRMRSSGLNGVTVPLRQS